MGRFAITALIADIVHEASGGSETLLRARTRGTGDAPHEVSSAAGLRMVVDFADLDASRIVISTGQSGHPLSRHYDDMSELWRRGDAVRMSLDPADAEAGSLGTLVIAPGG
jgi:Protein related to penicillin acylase